MKGGGKEDLRHWNERWVSSFSPPRRTIHSERHPRQLRGLRARRDVGFVTAAALAGTLEASHK